MSTDTLIDDFVAESAEALEGLDAELSEVLTTGTTAPLHKVFRAVHTVKGTAGFLGLLNVKNFAHQIEDVLDKLRSGQLQLTPILHQELVTCLDLLAEQIPRAATLPPTPTLTTEEESASARLSEAAGIAVVDDRSALQKIAAFIHGPIEPDVDSWLATVRGMLASWKDEKQSTTAALADEREWLTIALRSRFVLKGESITELVRPVLEFFQASHEGRLSDSGTETFLMSLDVLSRRCAALGNEDIARRLNATATECRIIHESPVELDELLVSTLEDQVRAALDLMQRSDAGEASSKQTVSKETKAPSVSSKSEKDKKSVPSVRVREDLLDKFIWHVGETYLALERYRELQHRLAEAEVPGGILTDLTELNRELTVAVSKLQQSVMDIRRVPIGSLFNKVPTMVRQLAPQLGKQVEVEITGSENRIDKSLLQELEGPMTHIVRNALDHGLDTPEERAKRGRPPVGRLRLACRAEKDVIVIEIEDDGRGIDVDRVRAKAVERGLITSAQAASLSPEETYQLLCRPGFSTAEKISDVSGRGVGLDVVAAAVSKNRGKLAIHSQVGVGTQFTLSFPVHSTVLMVDGLLCNSGDRYAAFGVEYISEVVRLEPSILRTVAGTPMAIVRGQTYRIYSLADVFDAVEIQSEPSCVEPSHGIVLSHQHRRCLLRVDQLLGYRKLVLKGLDRSLIRSRLLSGVAQLGGTKLALVFDVPELLSFFESKTQRDK